MKKYFGLFLILLPTGWILACDCLPVDVNSQFGSSSYVFYGSVVSVHDLGKGEVLGSDSDERFVEASIEIIEMFKGRRTEVRSVRTLDNEAACGVSFVPGREYLFFIDANGLVHLCGTIARTQTSTEFSEALSRLRELSQGMPNNALH